MLPSALSVMTSRKKSGRLVVRSHLPASTFNFEITDSQAAKIRAWLFQTLLMAMCSVIILGTFVFVSVNKKQVLSAWMSE